jgi:hypothetical protein
MKKNTDSWMSLLEKGNGDNSLNKAVSSTPSSVKCYIERLIKDPKELDKFSEEVHETCLEMERAVYGQEL